MKKLNVSMFELIYIGVAVTTFIHTAWATATVFEGPIPDGSLFPLDAASGELWLWWITGALMAITIDVGMFVIARRFRSAGNAMRWTLGGTFVVLAASSFLMQLLYTVSHTQEIEMTTGVVDYWQTALTPLIEARVVIFPLMLPVFATLYTIAQSFDAIEHEEKERATNTVKSKSGRRRTIKSDLTKAFEFFERNEQFFAKERASGKEYGPYKSHSSRMNSIRSVVRRRQTKTTAAA